MKFPHSNLAVLAAFLALASCQKEYPFVTNAVPVPDSTIVTRCCDGGVLLDDPTFIDIFNLMQIGLVEPGFTLFDAIDSTYLVYAIDQLASCLESGGDHLECITEFESLLSVDGFLSNYLRLDSLTSVLAENYGDQGYDQFSTEFLVAVGIFLTEEYNNLPAEKKVPCYEAFQRAIVETITDFLAGLITADVTAYAYLYRDIVLARYDLCNCLYNTYGYSC